MPQASASALPPARFECNDVSHLWNDKAQWPLCTPLRDLWTRSRGPSPRAPKCSSADKLPIPPHPHSGTPSRPPQPLWTEPPGGVPARVCFFSHAARRTQKRRVAVLAHYCANEQRGGESERRPSGNLWIFAINISPPLCGRRPYSQVCIYSSLWPQCKFSEMAISGVLGVKIGGKKREKKMASGVSRIPLVSFRWL